MTRKLRPLGLQDLQQLPTGCGGCGFWEAPAPLEHHCSSMGSESAREWYVRVTDEWGSCGRAAYDDDRVIGLIKYAPSRYFPQAFTFRAAPDDPAVPLIACLHIVPEARHRGLGGVLIRSALGDLAKRGEKKVQAIAAVRKPEDLDESPFIGMDFLARSGFIVEKPDPEYPLMKLDVRSLLSIADNLEAVLQSLRLPRRSVRQAPASWMKER